MTKAEKKILVGVYNELNYLKEVINSEVQPADKFNLMISLYDNYLNLLLKSNYSDVNQFHESLYEIIDICVESGIEEENYEYCGFMTEFKQEVQRLYEQGIKIHLSGSTS